MKIFSIIKKSLKENVRHIWLLILTISLTPFFVGFYWAVSEAEKPNYKILLVNQDDGIIFHQEKFNYGNLIIEGIKSIDKDSLQLPMTIKTEKDKSFAVEKLKDKNADALVVFPSDFSKRFQNLLTSNVEESINIEFVGDRTSIRYMCSWKL